MHISYNNKFAPCMQLIKDPSAIATSVTARVALAKL